MCNSPYSPRASERTFSTDASGRFSKSPASSRKSLPSAVSVTPRGPRCRRSTPISSSRSCAAKDAGVKHFIWSTLPDVEAISAGKFDVPHFTGKAKIDLIVKEGGFRYHTFVIAPGYYQNFVGSLAPQKQADGSVGWALPLNPDVRCLHVGESAPWF